MKLKHILVGGAIAAISFGTGKIVGEVKCAIYAINEFEKIFPGMKEAVVRNASDRIISNIFKSKNEES